MIRIATKNQNGGIRFILPESKDSRLPTQALHIDISCNMEENESESIEKLPCTAYTSSKYRHHRRRQALQDRLTSVSFLLDREIYVQLQFLHFCSILVPRVLYLLHLNSPHFVDYSSVQYLRCGDSLGMFSYEL